MRGPLMSLAGFKNITVLFLFLIFLFFAIPTRAFAAPRLTLSPASTTVNNGDSTQINLLIDVESNNAFGADAILTIPSSDIDVTGVTNGGFFTDFNYAIDSANNRLEIHGYFSSLYQTKTGNGTLATVTLKAKKDSGSDTVPFICNGTSTATQILDSNGHNILDCANLNQLAFTFAGAPPGSTPTPTPTGTATPTPQPTTTQAPAAPGYVDPTCDGLAASPTSGKKPLAVTFVCTGESLHNDVTGAEFNFGNGHIQLVEKNIGSFGSISTSYTYPTEGWFGATCRLRDNNLRFSGTPDACTKTIQVTTASIIPAPKKPLVLNTQPQIVELVPYSSPSATPEPTLEPTEAPPQEENPWSRYFLGGGIALLALLLGLWLIGSSKKGKPPTQPPMPTPEPPTEELPSTTNELPVEETPVVESPPFSDQQ